MQRSATGRAVSFPVLLLLFILAHFSHHLITALIVPLLPYLRAGFALSYTQAGFLVSAFSLTYGLSQLPAGWLGDRIDTRLLLGVGTAGVAAAGLAIGLSGGFAVLVVLLVVMGFVGGGYHPAAAPLLAARLETHRQGRALGFHLIGGSASHFLAPLAAVGIAAAWSWRGAYIALSLPVLLFGLVFSLTLGRPPGPEDHRFRSGPAAAMPAPGKTRLAAFLVLTATVAATASSILAFVPLFLVDHFGLSEPAAAGWLALIYSAGLWAAPVGGFLSDRLGRVPLVVVCGLGFPPVIFALSLVSYGVLSGLLLFLMGVLLFMRMAASEAFLVESVPLRQRSTMLGIYFFAGLEGSGLLTPLLGFLIDRRGFAFAFRLFAAVLLAVVSVCAGLLRRGQPACPGKAAGGTL